MSMSRTTEVTVAGGAAGRVECAVRTVMGKPDDFLDQIKAILAPNPNLPRV
jgi:hypothetical protein